MDKLYQDSKFVGAFSGKKAFQRALPNVQPKKEIDKKLSAIDSYTLHKPVRKPKKWRRIFTKGIGYLYQMDLVDMQAYSRQNKGYRWIITVIDTFSKKLWCFKLKNKSADSVYQALRPLLEKNRPQKIETDGGGEFINKKFRDLFEKLKIDGYTISSDRKCAIVERVNRTLKTRMFRAFTARGRHQWYDILDDLVSAYNSSYHRSIKMAPNQVTNRNESVVRRNLFPPVKPAKPPKFRIGDTVRISRLKGVFTKGYRQTFSAEVFVIDTIKPTNPVTYGIKDYGGNVIKGSFYTEELQLVDKTGNTWLVEKVIRTRKRAGKTESLVKWYGYSDSWNSWVDKAQLLNNAS